MMEDPVKPEGICTLYADESGKHHLKTPNGERIPKLIWTRVYDGTPNEKSYVIMKVFVKIEPTEMPVL